MRLNKAKLFSVLALCFIALMAMSAFVSAVPVSLTELKVNGDELLPRGSTIRDFERGDGELEIKVFLTALADGKDLEVEAKISGYEYNDIEAMYDVTHPFDVEAGVEYVKKLYITLPQDMDRDQYRLRIRVSDRDSATLEEFYEFNVDTSRHNLMIKDVVLTPEYEVQAGRSLLASVRLENFGEKDEEGIKVKISIPELGVSASDYMDKLKDGDETTSEELWLRLPSCAKPGDYKVLVTVEYDRNMKETKEYMIKVVDGDACQTSAPTAPSEEKPTTEKTVITVGPETQDVKAGEAGVVYPLSLTNAGSKTKTYTVSAEIADWGSVRLSPSNVVVVEAGETKVVYVYVSARENAMPGQQLFALKVSSGDSTLKEIALKANVLAPAQDTSAWSSVKKALEYGVIVLVLLLVILGLVIGFNRLRSDSEDKEDVSGQTYY